MPVVTVSIRNTSYAVVCDAGQEELLHRLAASLDKRVAALAETQGKGSDIRLLLMAALMMENELVELKEKISHHPAVSTGSFEQDPALCEEINTITKRLETIASELDSV